MTDTTAPEPPRPPLQTTGRRLRMTVVDHVARTNTLSAYGTVVISVMIVIGFFGVLFFLLVKPLGDLSDSMSAIMNILLGALVAKFGDACAYWLGSSASSARKDAASPPPTVPPLVPPVPPAPPQPGVTP